MNDSASKFMWRQTNIFGEDEIQLTKNDQNWIIELNIEHLYVLIYIYKASEMKIGILKKESLKFLTVRTVLTVRYSQKSRGYKTERRCNFSIFHNEQCKVIQKLINHNLWSISYGSIFLKEHLLNSGTSIVGIWVRWSVYLARELNFNIV